MKTQTPATYGKPAMGCYLNQANRNSDSHNAAVVRLAMGLGFEPDADTIKLLAREDCEVLSEKDRSDSDALNWAADEAESWLNDQESRPFMYWANDGDVGAFGLWCNVEGAKEDVGFVTKRYSTPAARMAAQAAGECSADDSDYPSDDYRGEWLHVSDHGNATLYVREDAPKGSHETHTDREIWSVV